MPRRLNEQPALVQLDVHDEPALWSDLGFTVDDGRCPLGGLEVVLVGSEHGRGVGEWGWAGVAEPPVVGDLPARVVAEPPDGLSSSLDGERQPTAHPNSAVGLHYVVLFAPAWSAAAQALGELGLDPGEGRPFGPDADRQRSVAKAGGTAIEVIGATDPDRDPKATAWTLWGLVIEVADIDHTADVLGDRLGAVKPAVQRARRIATLDRSAGSSVPLAFLGPREG